MKKKFLSIWLLINISPIILASSNSKIIDFIHQKQDALASISPIHLNTQPKLPYCPTAYPDLTALEENETYGNRYKNIDTKYPEKRVITVPVTNLRFEPKEIATTLILPTSDYTNPLQITQLLLGEYIIAYEECIDTHNQSWLKVHAIQQEKFVGPCGWLGYPGWIKKDHTAKVTTFPSCNIVVHSMLANLTNSNGSIIKTISMGTKFQATRINQDLWQVILPNQDTAYIQHQDIYEIVPCVQESIEDLRRSIINKAKEFIGSWYSWGGRSAQSDLFGNISSVDCSALVNLSFLAHGLQLPRMSKEQFLSSTEIRSGADLQPGDLIFYASVFKNKNYKNPLQIDHIMIYLGDNQLLEATWIDGCKIRTTACDTRIGKPCHTIKSGEIIKYLDDEYFVYFGTFFNHIESLQKLRTNALEHSYNL
ncbi:C40 family peptidase [Candidatus Dependentiae bacterium]|nr:C40 family peptidase [Candidatus Dependentiae bacterium]